jgi:L-cysteine/cystine lyase
MNVSRGDLAQMSADARRQLLAALLRRDSDPAARASTAIADHAATAHAATAHAATGVPDAAIDVQRRQFPALRHAAYFNYGGRGPLPRPALDAISSALEETEAAGPFSHEAILLDDRRAESLRATLASTLSVRADAIALTENTTAACNVALWGIEWQPGDHLLISDAEHLSAIAVAQEIRDRFGVRLTSVDASRAARGAEIVDAVDRELRAETRLVLVSHVLWSTGVVVPVAVIRELCRHRTAGRCQLLIDGAQAAGVLGEDLDSDFYAFPASKWFCGPAGVAALIIGNDARERTRPVWAGWRGAIVDAPGTGVQWRRDARRYEGGTSCNALYRGWETAIQVHDAWGPADIRAARAIEMCRFVWSALAHAQDRGELPAGSVLSAYPPEAGILTLKVPDADALSRRLEADGVLLRSIPYNGSLRICAHYLTTSADVDRLMEALRACANDQEAMTCTRQVR